MSVDRIGKVLSSMRVMPTVGPNLTSDVFFQLIPSRTVIRSPLIWEVTRFSVNPFIKHDYKHGIAFAMWEILIGANELALKSGIKQYVAVFDSLMERYYRLCGWQPEIIGRKEIRPNEELLLGLWDVSQDISEKMIEKSGLERDRIYPKTLSEYAA